MPSFDCELPVHKPARPVHRSARPSRTAPAPRPVTSPGAYRPGSPVAPSDDAARRARFLALVGAHRLALEAVAQRLCRESAAAADLVQDTMERVWRRLDSLHDGDRVRGWLVQVMRNVWIDQLRRRRIEVPIEEIGEPPVVADDEPPWWMRITADDLRAAIEQIDEPYRSAAALHVLGGHSYRDIAQRLEIPNATAATRLHRAHRRLRTLLLRKLEHGHQISSS
jgi:RNA polymerase sigma factor (sigma-70 family)